MQRKASKGGVGDWLHPPSQLAARTVLSFALSLSLSLSLSLPPPCTMDSVIKTLDPGIDRRVIVAGSVNGAASFFFFGNGCCSRMRFGHPPGLQVSMATKRTPFACSLTHQPLLLQHRKEGNVMDGTDGAGC